MFFTLILLSNYYIADPRKSERKIPKLTAVECVPERAYILILFLAMMMVMVMVVVVVMLIGVVAASRVVVLYKW